MELTRNRIAERLSVRSGLPFDQALLACEAIELAMAKALVAKAGELRQRDTNKKPSRFANSAIFLRGFGRFDMFLNVGFIDKGIVGDEKLVNLRLVADGVLDQKLNPNLKPMRKHARHQITNDKLRKGILVRRKK